VSEVALRSELPLVKIMQVLLTFNSRSRSIQKISATEEFFESRVHDARRRKTVYAIEIEVDEQLSRIKRQESLDK